MFSPLKLGRRFLSALLALLAFPVWAGLSVFVGDIEHPAFSASGIRLDLTSGRARIEVARVHLPNQEFRDLKGECSRLRWGAGGVECLSGTLAMGKTKETLPFRFSARGSAFVVEIEPDSKERWRIARSENGDVKVEIVDGRVERLQTMLPLPKDWKLAGRVDGRLNLTAAGLEGTLGLNGIQFSDAAGDHAAENLKAEMRLSARLAKKEWAWEATLRWLGGEVYWKPIYAKADGQTLAARGRLGEERFEIASANLGMPGVGDITGSLDWSRRSNKMSAARVESANLDLAKGGSAYLMPILAEQGVPEIAFGGHLSFSLHWDHQGLATVGVGLNGVSLKEAHGRFFASGIHGGLPWQREGTYEGFLKVGAAKVGGFSLGEFEIPLLMEPRRFSVNRAEIPFLNSQVILERLVWRKSTKRQAWEGDLSLSLLPVPLAEVTKALGLPSMAGTLSGSFPRLRYREGAAYLDGALVIQVFEGYLNCTHLRLEDPFGTLPRLTADIDAQRLNLGQLTETFSFGRITGYVDAEVKGLELAGWKPTKFDAKVASSTGDYRKRISQRAVQNISSLGGGGAGAAIQASFLRFFEEFGYEKIGLSCVMRGGVCHMGGVEDAPNGYVMVKGGGIPALTVIGYNRQVDWTELVNRLRDIAQNNVRPVIQ